MSVMTNSRGQSRTPQVRLRERPFCPKRVKCRGRKPKSFSREKILPPMHSAMRALATKKAVKNMSSLVGRSRNNPCIMLKKRLFPDCRADHIQLGDEKNKIDNEQP